ncbi:hypothetical protein IEN85_07165 [Pelagicoccus sp. NFK12]|uniref:Lipoprotein n=1 Tax=Pelagicoccus enzymogenes TaxID=2773457 RepID=A0A927F996_9BACT|nr:hypothetical protein [Pelagicoccus enzymogenes]MBD5779268.1 hypothetical protein [Pelagicoccus enzymogenes]MDQ8198380.1 hypothetical protein [Pelagicoccus enzymogenes]
MKLFPAVSLLAALFLSACGSGPEPEYLEGEDKAAMVVTSFLTALQQGDEEKAKALTDDSPDYIIADFERCRDYFFERRPTGTKVMKTGYEHYAREWQIFVDLQINYGPQMKQLHFVLSPGEIPKVRGVTPIVPDLR